MARLLWSLLLGIGYSVAACSGGPARPTGERSPADPAAGPTADDTSPPASTGARSRPSVEQRCDALCTRYQACGVRDSEGCRPTCEREARRRHEHQSAPYLWRLIMCFDGLPCGPLIEGQGERACHDVALRQMSPSDTLRRFCSRSVQRAAACRRPADESDCLERYRIMDQASLRAALGCLERDCAEIPGCFARSLGFEARAGD